MIQTVLKRDGRVVGFNEEKIVAAVRRAMLHTDKGEDMQLAHEIADRIACRGQEQMSVEDIQNCVEIELMKSRRKDVADTPAGMMMKFSSETTKPFVDDYLLVEEVKNAVRQGYLHIHDKDYYPTKSLTCVQHPLDKILKNGFYVGHGESRPAKRIETASILGCISLETAQNEMHGGQAIPAFDFYLAPYVRNSFIEEVKVLEEITGEDYKHLYHFPIKDYVRIELDGLSGVYNMRSTGR